MPKIIATKRDWILLGYKLFSDKGISGIVIEKMAKKLKVNKSSFYWHFSTKANFVHEIIGYWEKESTSDIIYKVNKESNPKARFEKLIELSFRKDNNIDFIFYLKKYARTDKRLNNLMKELDNQRMAYTSKVLEQLGLAKSDAKVKSSIFYKYLIGYHEMIRYKKQKSNYMTTVQSEINHFINF